MALENAISEYPFLRGGIEPEPRRRRLHDQGHDSFGALAMTKIAERTHGVSLDDARITRVGPFRDREALTARRDATRTAHAVSFDSSIIGARSA